MPNKFRSHLASKFTKSPPSVVSPEDPFTIGSHKVQCKRIERWHIVSQCNQLRHWCQVVG